MIYYQYKFIKNMYIVVLPVIILLFGMVAGAVYLDKNNVEFFTESEPKEEKLPSINPNSVEKCNQLQDSHFFYSMGSNNNEGNSIEIQREMYQNCINDIP